MGSRDTAASLNSNFDINIWKFSKQEMHKGLNGFDSWGLRLQELHRVSLDKNVASSLSDGGSCDCGFLPSVALHEFGFVLLHMSYNVCK